jgi:hypothetical protein
MTFDDFVNRIAEVRGDRRMISKFVADEIGNMIHWDLSEYQVEIVEHLSNEIMALPAEDSGRRAAWLGGALSLWCSFKDRAKARWIEQLRLICPQLSTFDELFAVCDLLGAQAKLEPCLKLLEDIPSLVPDKSGLAALPHGWFLAVTMGRPELIDRARWVVGGLLLSDNTLMRAEARSVLGRLNRWASMRGVGVSTRPKGGRQPKRK